MRLYEDVGTLRHICTSVGRVSRSDQATNALKTRGAHYGEGLMCIFKLKIATGLSSPFFMFSVQRNLGYVYLVGLGLGQFV